LRLCPEAGRLAAPCHPPRGAPTPCHPPRGAPTPCHPPRVTRPVSPTPRSTHPVSPRGARKLDACFRVARSRRSVLTVVDRVESESMRIRPMAGGGGGTRVRWWSAGWRWALAQEVIMQARRKEGMHTALMNTNSKVKLMKFESDDTATKKRARRGPTSYIQWSGTHSMQLENRDRKCAFALAHERCDATGYIEPNSIELCVRTRCWAPGLDRRCMTVARRSVYG
jgi:hypothetical protein